MNIIIKGRKIEITDAIKEKINKKLGKLNKFFDEETRADVTLRVEKDRQIIEVTIFSNGIIYRAEYSDSDMYVAIDNIVDVIEGQIRKNKTRLEKRIKTQAFAPENFESPEPEQDEYKIVKRKAFSFKPMGVEEAILQMNLLDHSFYVFRDVETETVSVVYRRNNGGYGLIETN